MTENLLNESQITQLLGGLDGGPSPFGISYYKKLYECAKKAQLNEEYKQLQEEEEPDEEPKPKSTPGKLRMASVGIHGHQLFEQRWKQQLGQNIAFDMRASSQTPELAEAIRLYNNFNNEWGDLQSYLGMHIDGAEVRIGEEPGVDAQVRASLGGPLTGRLDAAGEMYDSHVLAENTGLHLMPGRYIVDYKFGKAHKKSDPIDYPQSLQGAAYLFLDALHNPTNPALGVLFIRIIGHKTMLRNASYVVYYCPRRDTDQPRLQALVRMGLNAQYAFEQFGEGNPLSCVNGQYGDECYFKKQRICPGF